jgi:predicted GH43/DUF377 family glycosyl hydrolase
MFPHIRLNKQRRRLGVILIAIMVLSALSSSIPRSRAEDRQPLLNAVQQTPVIEHATAAWERTFAYTDPGAVIFHDGKFHMFRNSFKSWPAPVSIAYMTSPDGVTWTEMAAAPVLESPNVPLTKVAALASSVIVMEDGTWVLYFYTWNTYSGRAGNGAIGRATAAEPTGPWTVDAEPALRPGEKGAWDDGEVGAPHVVKTATGYAMYYAGFARTGRPGGRIGLATSADGIRWEKQAEPVMATSETWEGRGVTQVRVVAYETGWLMLYRASGKNPERDMGIGLAYSKDGKAWTKFGNGAAFLVADMPEQTAFWFVSSAVRNDEVFVYLEMLPKANPGVTNIFTMTLTKNITLPE